MIITLKNKTKRMRVYQLGQQYAAGAYKSRSENIMRLRQRADGGTDIRQERLRHGPVLRILAGETKEVPAALLHDPLLRRDTQGRNPPLAILKRESDEAYAARLAGPTIEPTPEPKGQEPQDQPDAATHKRSRSRKDS